MGLWQRFTLIFKSKANKALDKAEDPRETLDYSYEKQLELLQKVRRGVADVATSRKRLELQIQGLAQQEAKLEEQARAALAGGREDLAREALTRRSGLHQQIADLQIAAGHPAGPGGEADGSRAAAPDQGGGLPHQEGDHQGHLLGRGGDDQDQRGLRRASPTSWATSAWPCSAPRTRRRRCRHGPARSTSSSPSGALTDVSSMGKDNITVELERMASENDVNAQLEAMKRELSPGAAKPEIEG